MQLEVGLLLLDLGFKVPFILRYADDVFSIGMRAAPRANNMPHFRLQLDNTTNAADGMPRVADNVAPRRSRAEILEGFQDNHIISDKNALTKNHELLDLADFDLKSRNNKIFLPTVEALHPTRSLHFGTSSYNCEQKLS